MPTERIQILITERGSRRVVTNINRISRTSDRAGNRINFLRAALGTLGTGLVLRSLTRLADETTNIGNRLRLVTEDTANLNTVFEALVDVSNSTRTALQSNAELFTRTALATRELGLTQQQLIDFTETLAQATVLSGASAQEAANAIRQLSQGLQNGALRGDEFRSVSEQLPVILEVIARDLGITRGELRELAFQGGLTGEIIVGAFLRARDTIGRDFAQTVPTIGQAFNVFGNNVRSFVRDINEANSISETLARTIIALGDNIETIARVIIGGVLVVSIFAAVAALRALTAAALANPFLLLATALSSVISLLITFRDQIIISRRESITLGDTLRAFFTVVRRRIEEVIPILRSVATFFLTLFGIAIEEGESVFGVLLRTVGRFAENTFRILSGLTNSLIVVFTNLTTVVEILFRQLANSIIDIFEQINDDLSIDLIRRFDAIFNFVVSSAITIAEIVNQQFLTNLRVLQESIGIGFDTLETAVRATRRIPRLDVAERRDALELGIDIGNAFRDGFQSGGSIIRLIDDIIVASREEARNRLARDEEARRRREAEIARLRLTRLGAPPGEEDPGSFFEQFVAGIQDGFSRIVTLAQDVAGQVSDALVSAFREAEDAFAQFVRTGEVNFNEFTQSIIEDLARLAFRQSFLNLVGLFSRQQQRVPGLNFFGGGPLPGLNFFGGGPQPRQEGGPVSRGLSFLVGERGPELFVPSQSGTIIPNDGLGQTIVNAPININLGADTQRGAQRIRQSARQLQGAIVNGLSRRRFR